MKERLVLWGALVCALVFVLACNLPSSSSSNVLDTPVVVTSTAATPPPTSPSAESDLVLPAPVVRFSHVTNSAVEGTKLYWFDLVNWQDFPPELFKITKGVPPCGQRPNRLWVIFRRADTMEEISHGCGARSPEELRTLELPLKESAGIPHRVVVDLWDRLTDKHYLSEPVTFP